MRTDAYKGANGETIDLHCTATNSLLGGLSEKMTGQWVKVESLSYDDSSYEEKRVGYKLKLNWYDPLSGNGKLASVWFRARYTKKFCWENVCIFYKESIFSYSLVRVSHAQSCKEYDQTGSYAST